MKKVTVQINGVDTEVYVATEVDTVLENRIQENLRLKQERDEHKTARTTAEASLATVQTELDTTKNQIAEKDTAVSAANRTLKIFEVLGDKVNPGTLKELSNLPMFANADLDTEDGIKSVTEQFSQKFAGLMRQAPPQEGAGTEGQDLTPLGGTGKGSTAGSKIITDVTQLAGKSHADINAWFDQQVNNGS